MTTQVARTPWPVAVRAHFGLLWWSRRARMLLMITLGMYAMLEAMLALLNSGGQVEGVAMTFLPITDLVGVIVMISAGWGIAVWRGETKEQRVQMLAAPIDVSHHELARVAAGVLWLVITIASFVVLGVVVAGMKGAFAIFADVSWIKWLLLFTGPLLAYALIVPASTVTPRAMEIVLLSIMLFYMTIMILTAAGYAEFVQKIMEPVVMGRFGLNTALVGGGPRAGGTAMGAWSLAYALWLSLASGALYAALRWRRGRA